MLCVHVHVHVRALLSVSTVDSTVSEPEQPVAPTPARSLHLLHLSGQGTLVQQSLSQ